GKQAWCAVAHVRHFVADRLQAFHQSGRTQRRGRLFTAREECGGARWRADDGNLVRLTDDFDRQGSLLVLRKPLATLAWHSQRYCGARRMMPGMLPCPAKQKLWNRPPAR